MTLILLAHLACKKQVQETPPPVPAQPDPVVVEEPEQAPSNLPEEVLQLVQNFQKVYFELDQSLLSDDGEAALGRNVQILQENPDIRIEIQGHADQRGTTEYNLALGQRRAATVAEYLSVSGVDASRLKVVSYGEERPLMEEPSESAFSKNRRCEFVIVWGGKTDVKGSDEADSTSE